MSFTRLSRPTAPPILARAWPLLALLALVLFPFGWLGQEWPAFGQVIDLIFATAREHAVGHAALFAILGAALLLVFPALRRRPALYLAVIMIAALGQEAFQLAYKQRPLVYDDARDLVTDLIGALLALALVTLVARWREAAGNREGREGARREF
jgi:hypothetical protein